MPAQPSAPRSLDLHAVERFLARAAGQAHAPWLHGEVARRMAQRLAVIKRVPDTVVDWWGFLGDSQAVLAQAYPKAEIVTVEPGAALLERSRAARSAPWWSARRWRGGGGQVVLGSELAPGRAQLLWANMMLHAAADPTALMAQWRRALQVDGFLMFSTLGPDSLAELRELYAALGWGSPGTAFVDMHDLGDMLVAAGFADPVMDQERLTLTWPDAPTLLAELRTLGLNADPARAPGWRTPRWRARLEAALAARAGADGRIALRFELVYGHAFVPPPRAPVAAQTEVGLEEMQAMLRARRASPR